MIVALSALVLSIGGLIFGIADAYASRTTVLAKALQSVGLCPVKQETVPLPVPTVTVTSAPKPSASASASVSPTPSAKPTINSDPTPTPVKGAAGANGSAGNTGATGATGATGEKGEKGDKGDKGDTGSSGSTGPQGPAGICDLSNILEVNGDLIPAIDNTYSLGTSTKRWKDLHVGPGTIYIQETTDPANQVAISVQAGALKFEGAQALKVGNIRLSATGITSENQNSPITLGDNAFNSFVQLQANGLKFKDGTTQSTAASDGATGPKGDKGDTGPQGPRGEPGTVEGFIEVPVCIDTENNGQNKMSMYYGSCEKLEMKGTDITMLQRK